MDGFWRGHLRPFTFVIADYDKRRAAALTRARRRATGLLALVFSIFVSTFFMGDATWVGYLRSAAEAGTIGGLADWFAVVALFRHPLGVPIPHTAIIPRSKDGLGQNLAQFVRHNFLSSESVIERMEEADIPMRVGEWLTDHDHADALAARLVTTLGALSEGLDSSQIETEMERIIVDRLRSAPLADMMGKGLEIAMEDGQHTPLVTAAIQGIASGLEDNRPSLRTRLGDESPWWVPEAIDDAVFETAYDAVQRYLVELAEQPDHEIRRRVDARLTDLAVRLRNDEELRAQVVERTDALLDHPRLREWARGTWSAMARGVSEAAERPDSELRSRLAATLQGLGVRLTDDPSLRERIWVWLHSLAEPMARVGERELTRLISTTVQRWDADDTSRRLELWMGRDLQFVRINGTLVGALAGLLIHTVVQLLTV
ncbi:MAG: DUF445 family protein [Acidimicrobiia bacterium]|nr:DUF445 family protein [Acidimicrobiia bacterium]